MSEFFEMLISLLYIRREIGFLIILSLRMTFSRCLTGIYKLLCIGIYICPYIY